MAPAWGTALTWLGHRYGTTLLWHSIGKHGIGMAPTWYWHGIDSIDMASIWHPHGHGTDVGRTLTWYNIDILNDEMALTWADKART